MDDLVEVGLGDRSANSKAGGVPAPALRGLRVVEGGGIDDLYCLRASATAFSEAALASASRFLSIEISSVASLSSSLRRCDPSSRLTFSNNSCSKRIFSSKTREYFASISAKLDETARSFRSKSSFPISSSRNWTLISWYSCRSLSSSRCSDVVVVL